MGPPITKEEFVNQWPGGYTECWGGGYTPDLPSQLGAVIEQHSSRDGTCLEIGCGSGISTARILLPRFKRVIALDYLPAIQVKAPNLEYRELSSMDFTCGGLPDNSVDFVYSFGVFCHVHQQNVFTYLHHIHRVLKPGCKAMLMFANNTRYADAPYCGWVFYSDVETVRGMILKAGFVEFLDSLPNCRDTIAIATKAP